MSSPLSKFRRWLSDRRHFRIAWFEKDPQLTPEPEEALTELPDDVSQALVDAINDLPSQPQEVECVLEALDSAIAKWRANPHLANNSLVILAHPVSSVSRILTEGLHKLRSQKEDPLDIKLLDWVERPLKQENLKQQIKEKLGWKESNFPNDWETENNDAHNMERSSYKDSRKTKPTSLAVIPNLCWCFLRSAEGLEGVDYLQETLLSDRAQFWAIGSGQVGWEYLKSTLKLHAYCGDTVSLPVLSGEEIQAWLQPLVEKFGIRFSDAAIHKRLQHPSQLLSVDIPIGRPIEAVSNITQEVSATVQSSIRALKSEVFSEEDNDDEEASPKRDYFNRLADISDGVSVVALQLFVKSLRYRKITSEEIQAGTLSPRANATVNSEVSSEAGSEMNCEEASDEGDDRIGTPESSEKQSDKQSDEQSLEEPPSDKQLIATIPKLPPLPELSQNDFYLLYSLMLHGDLTIRALANSLGDAPQIVNNQVQMLRNVGVIEQKDGVIKTNPTHYPKLRRELSRNNFIIEVP